MWLRRAVGVRVLAGVVTALQNDVNHLAQRFQKREEHVEQALGGNGRGEHRQPELGPPVAEHVHAVPLARPHRQTGTGPNRVGKCERTVGIHGQVCGQPVRSHGDTSRDNRSFRPGGGQGKSKKAKVKRQK